MGTTDVRIRVSLAFLRGLDTGIFSRGDAVVKGMTGNAAYSQPPADLAVLKTTLDSYSSTITAALDGGKAAIANRNSYRQSVSKTLRLLGHYVEATSNGDPNTTISSGFEVLNVTRTQPQPVAVPTIRNIDQGSSGELLVSIAPVDGAVSYELRNSLQTTGGAPAVWTSQPVTRIRPTTSVNGLTPGGTYQFQVRALGHLGFTDWSNVFVRMSI